MSASSVACSLVVGIVRLVCGPIELVGLVCGHIDLISLVCGLVGLVHGLVLQWPCWPCSWPHGPRQWPHWPHSRPRHSFGIINYLVNGLVRRPRFSGLVGLSLLLTSPGGMIDLSLLSTSANGLVDLSLFEEPRRSRWPSQWPCWPLSPLTAAWPRQRHHWYCSPRQQPRRRRQVASLAAHTL